MSKKSVPPSTTPAVEETRPFPEPQPDPKPATGSTMRIFLRPEVVAAGPMGVLRGGPAGTAMDVPAKLARNLIAGGYAEAVKA